MSMAVQVVEISNRGIERLDRLSVSRILRVGWEREKRNSHRSPVFHGERQRVYESG